MNANSNRACIWRQPRTVIMVSVLLVVLLGVIGVLGYKMWWQPSLPIITEIEDFTLDNIDGTQFHSNQAKGKARLVAFIYTNCPDICPATTFYMVELQNELKQKGLFGNEVSFWSISFDPKRDTPEALAKYADSYGADRNGWYFLRAEKEVVEDVAKRFGVGVLERENGIYLHTMRTFLLDEQNNVRAIYGMAAEMETDVILADIEKLVREK